MSKLELNLSKGYFKESWREDKVTENGDIVSVDCSRTTFFIPNNKLKQATSQELQQRHLMMSFYRESKRYKMDDEFSFHN
jgi:hypothetical protein